MNLLLIEDDLNICDLISLYIKKNGWHIRFETDGHKGLAAYYDDEPDLVIIDIMLPEINGLEVCKEIRQDDQLMPILMLTGKGETEDIVKGLETGADDYLVKPFDPHELMARIKSLARRSFPFAGDQGGFTYGNTVVHLETQSLTIQDEPVSCAPRELMLLQFLVRYQEQTLSRAQILDQIWGKSFEGDPRTVDVHMKRIREKLRKHGSDWHLITVRGVGYRLETKGGLDE
ncbi:response regulator transcription factor [Salisediminibacterium beveridgei]|uniref:Two-component response regulator n=1 Tax=Salisediminibacterium beveridgei TaxID=632773 RepID=A0A1D7QYE7_9BACI|nr:response regulator transcription factor [Salisediminibacterium beveridgei]AOM83998.1 two-component response regulator [Salisediminibacterium beveridgei]